MTHESVLCTRGEVIPLLKRNDLSKEKATDVCHHHLLSTNGMISRKEKATDVCRHHSEMLLKAIHLPIDFFKSFTKKQLANADPLAVPRDVSCAVVETRMSSQSRCAPLI